MPSVFSRRHPVNFYIALFFIELFWAFMALMSGGTFIHNYGTDQFETRNYGLLIMLAAEIAGAIYSVVRYFKLGPTIELNNKFIKFYSTQYSWSDVDKIELHGKRSFIFFTAKEGTSIVLKSGSRKMFLDNLYSNTGEIKRFIQDVVIDQKPFASEIINAPAAKEAYGEAFTNYKGVQFYNYRGILLWLIEIVMVYVAAVNRNTDGILIFCLITALVSFFAFSYFMNYFQLSSRFFSVRNHNLLWKRKLYRLNDIREIVFEQPDKMPNCLRVITHDFESKQYPAATLRDKTWRQLKEDLEKRGVKIRNECIPDYVPFEFKLFND
ncbi:MAG: hypothetical protein JST50_22100 [Bacteroidetes bacterium]|jgi:hypothetical protein|nr:hypothetical protein [Bacteroidota bacterium]